MLVIPAPVDGATTLDILIDADPAAAGVPACTPEFASRLRDRWHGATLHRDAQGALFVRLPLARRVAHTPMSSPRIAAERTGGDAA
jgi:hypothetical protein